MILSCQNIEKAFLEKQVLKNCSFHIEDYEKAAIVGLNGAGKTTLLRIIVGQLEPDGGVVAFAKDKTFGYLAQDSAVNSDNTIYEELLSVKQHLLDLENQIRQAELSMKQLSGDALEELMQKYADLTHRFEMENGYAYKSELTGVLKGLGFTEDEFQKPVSTLSGGQKTRVARGKLLLQKPDLIILDEFGYVPFDIDGARLLYQIIAGSYERRSIALTTNIESGKWGTIFADDKLAAAIIDRIMHHGRLLEFTGQSRRVSEALMFGRTPTELASGSKEKTKEQAGALLD